MASTLSMSTLIDGDATTPLAAEPVDPSKIDSVVVGKSFSELAQFIEAHREDLARRDCWEQVTISSSPTHDALDGAPPFDAPGGKDGLARPPGAQPLGDAVDVEIDDAVLGEVATS